MAEKKIDLPNYLITPHIKNIYTHVFTHFTNIISYFTGMNRKVTYGLEGNDIFLMDRQTGILSVTQSLDREKQAMYNLTVIAKDHGTPQLSSRTNILVLVSGMSNLGIGVN